MTEPKFTPGPWALESRRDICDEFECWLHPINLHIHDRISDADAHLIAASPELYEALEHIEEYWNRDQNTSAMSDALWHIIEVAQAALAKARGEGHE